MALGGHRRQKGWGYVAATPPDFRVLHRILIFTIEILFSQLISPALFSHLPLPILLFPLVYNNAYKNH